MSDIAVIQNKIYEIRGRKVMLDYELAALYGVETAQLKRAVRRNIRRFEGEDFMIVLSPKDAEELRSRCHFGTMNEEQGKLKRGENIKYEQFALMRVEQ